jgi:hypothetical protein
VDDEEIRLRLLEMAAAIVGEHAGGPRATTDAVLDSAAKFDVFVFGGPSPGDEGIRNTQDDDDFDDEEERGNVIRAFAPRDDDVA